MQIANEQDFKAALGRLSAPELRQVCALLVRQAFELSGDPRVRAALDLAAEGNPGAMELASAAAAANSARVESFAKCGHDTDWRQQASHFVARAAQECVKPTVEFANAWEAAMQARMARICANLAAGAGTDNPAAEAQYLALEALLQAKESRS